MTENKLREKVVNWLVQYRGIKEGSEKHKDILSIFNKSKLCTRYTMTVNDEWCATTVSADFISCGLADIFPCVECSCYYMVEKAKKANIWVESDSYTPKIGDVILYNWSDGNNYASTDNKGTPNHVGIVASVSGKTIKVIEGNKGETVAYRTLAVNGRYIRGYITPEYYKKATESSDTNSKTTTTEKTTANTSSDYNFNKTEKWAGVVNTSKLNVRTWAGTDNKLCSFSPLKKNKKVSVCDSIKDSDGVVWYYIKYNGKYGFVSSKYITKKTTTAKTTVLSTASKKVEAAESFSSSLTGKYKVTSNLNLRVGAGTNKKSLCVIPKGSYVNNYGYYTASGNVKWYYVSYTNKNGKSYLGFCVNTYLKK